MSVLGNRVLRTEDPRFLTVGGRYVADLDDPLLEGALHVAYVRSVVAHGRILSVEVDDARAVPGVVAVYTGARVEAIERGAQSEPGLLGKIAAVVGLGASTMPTGEMSVRLSTGQQLKADLVISATGVRPNIGFLENSARESQSGTR